MSEAIFAANPEALQELAANFARSLAVGDVVALDGDLGAGKTTFTQGLMAGLGYEGEVTSPTFSLVQEYKTARFPVFHFDFYRLESEGEIEALGWDDYLERGGLVIVEWASLFPELLPPHTRWIKIAIHEKGRMIRM